MPTTSSGSTLYGSDYNTVQTLVTEVLGSGLPYGPTGSGDVTYGYNQTPSSSLISAGSLVTAAQWNALANDINTCYLHQNNSNFSGYANPYVNSGSVITAAKYNTLFTAMTGCVTNRTTAASAQLAQTTQLTSIYGSTWGTSNHGITTNGTISFASAAQLQYFFNQGGSLIWQGLGPSSPSNTNSTAWQTMLSAFTYTLNLSQFALLTGTLTQVYYAATEPSPYSSSYIQLQMSVTGGTITWFVTYQNNDSSGYAANTTVNAGVGYYIYQKTATGAFTGYSAGSVSGGTSWTTT